MPPFHQRFAAGKKEGDGSEGKEGRWRCAQQFVAGGGGEGKQEREVVRDGRVDSWLLLLLLLLLRKWFLKYSGHGVGGLGPNSIDRKPTENPLEIPYYYTK